MPHNEYREEAFQEYYGISTAVATMVILKYLRSRDGLIPADCEDVAQEAMATMVIKLDQPDRTPIANGRGFAVNVAKRRLQDLFRRSQRQQEHLHSDPDEEFERELADVHSAEAFDLVADRTVETVQVLIAELSPKLRDVAILLWDPHSVDFNALPHIMVADILKIPVGTVKSRLSLVRQKVGERLRHHMHGEPEHGQGS